VTTGLGKGAAYAVASVGLEKAVSLGIALYLPRHLGLADYGHYTFLLAYLGLFQALPDASLETVLVARLARTGGDIRAAGGQGALVRLGVSVLGAGLGLGLLWLTTGDAALVQAGVVAAAGLAAIAGTPYRALLRARLEMRRYVLLLAGQGTLAVGLLGAVVHAGGGLVPVLGAVTTAAVAGVGLGRLLVGSGARLRSDGGLARALLAEAWPLAGTTLALVAASQAVQVLLLRLHGAPAVGLYGASQKLVEAAALLPRALMLSVLPALALATQAPGGAVGPARDAARVLVIALLPPAVALGLWAEPVLVAAFGPPFAAAAPVLRVLAPAVILGATGSVLTNLLVALGLQGLLLRVTGGAAVLMAVLGAALVPAHGAVGAAAALVTSMAGGQLVLLAVPATRRHVLPVIAAVARPLALGGLAAAGVVALGMPLGLGVALLIVGYAVALAVTGTVTRADVARWLRA
jgi:O-antigen/teichoic acid export membrane protein